MCVYIFIYIKKKKGYRYNLIIQKWQVEDWLIQSSRSAMESVSPGGDKPPRSSHVDRDTPSVGKLAHAKCALSTSIDTAKEMSFPYRPVLLCHQTSKISRLEACPSQNICFCQCTCVIWTMPTLDTHWVWRFGARRIDLHVFTGPWNTPFASFCNLDLPLGLLFDNHVSKMLMFCVWTGRTHMLTSLSATLGDRIDTIPISSPDPFTCETRIPWASMPICPKDQAAAAFTWSSKRTGT